MKNILKNRRGAALILVIATIAFLTMVTLDMFDDSLVSHQLAVNYRARVQAYYLAKSGISFSKLLLYYNKQVESSLAKKNTSMAALGYEPLYKMIPLSSEAIRGMISMNSFMNQDEDAEADVEEDVDETAEEGVTENKTGNVSMLQKDEIKEFLNFTGDFDVEINEEQSKYSVNAVSKMTPTSSGYDLHKRVLLSLLMQPKFKSFFGNQDRDAQTLVHAIADFIDANTLINDFDQVERGSENALYATDAGYEVKNSALLTLSELRLVTGMSDDIFEALKPMVTVYHTSEKINFCLADEDIADALIVHYTKYAECTNPLDEEKDADEIAEIREEILTSCPDKAAIATALNVKLGIVSASDASVSSTTTTAKTTSSKVAECKIQFEDLLTEDNNIFEIKAFGRVNNVDTAITVVLDTSSSKASGWKILHYQVN